MKRNPKKARQGSVNDSKVRIGIIGAGRGGYGLLQVLKDIPEVDVVGICDINPAAPGFVEAKQLGIPTYLDLDLMLREQPISWLINVTHKSLTQRHILSQDLKGVTVIDGHIAELIWLILSAIYNQIHLDKAKKRSSKDHVKVLYTLAWDIIQQVVDVGQPIQTELANIAFQDPLTGLYSRRLFMQFLDREISGSIREVQPFALVIIDIDHFKSVNDQFGHDAGDQVLRQFADLLNASHRTSDLVARYGGEEFIAVLPNTTLHAACMWAEQLRKQVEKRLVTPEGGPITISLGVATFDPDKYPERPEQLDSTSMKDIRKKLLQQADHALYEAKGGGRNRVIAFTPAEASAGGVVVSRTR
ncbi:MAG: GGDEF domain-containing protein [Gammaproteobacteria bacterium]|nr:GGDEF domain-containing protein [Gammaproteobacteria bacterium]MCI0590755.1 GGDEF domain-containing protein [Gammaproteobacteria bacterium]